MSRKGKRDLSPDDREVWDRVKRQATPLHKARAVAKPQDVFQPEPEAPRKVSPFQIGTVKTSTTPHNSPSQKTPEIRMDRKAFGQLKRGKLKPEARLDLHGMTLAHAGPALRRFIDDSFTRGRRLVLVITGKGKDRDDGGPIPVPRGVLRRQVPDWLSRPPLSVMVLQVSEAHKKHGGEGAFYVYLRRGK